MRGRERRELENEAFLSIYLFFRGKQRRTFLVYVLAGWRMGEKVNWDRVGRAEQLFVKIRNSFFGKVRAWLRNVYAARGGEGVIREMSSSSSSFNKRRTAIYSSPLPVQQLYFSVSTMISIATDAKNQKRLIRFPKCTWKRKEITTCHL